MLLRALQRYWVGESHTACDDESQYGHEMASLNTAWGDESPYGQGIYIMDSMQNQNPFYHAQ